jgi:glycosyltransferase involved in cell wall biosynthesis
MRTYRTAHALAARGHNVHVVTNAKEAQPPFRMHMRPEDCKRCEAHAGAGSVTVHWTDPVDRSQSYLPMASPFVSKLATIAARAHSAHPFDVIFSHYLEPYGVAGYLASQMTGLPHVVRMAGSDAGRLWRHPQLEGLYDHVLQSADIVVAVGPVAERAVLHGVEPERIVPGGAYALPEDEFAPEGPVLDLAALKTELGQSTELRDLMWGDIAADMPHFGIYGKLGDNKGSFALLAAMARLKRDGLNVGLVALAHGRPDIERRFRERVSELGLTGRVLQIPFLPHWRVPEFVRGCLAVCCLEQDFPISVHSPIVPFEVLLCGSCLVASTEVIRKLPQWERLPHGYGCVAIKDVNDVEELSGKLAAIAREPRLTAAVGARGRRFARDCQEDAEFPERLEAILTAAAERRPLPSGLSSQVLADEAEPDAGRFPLTQIIAAALPAIDAMPSDSVDDLARAERILTALKEGIARGKSDLGPLAQAVQVEIAVARAEDECPQGGDATADPLFRLGPRRWALEAGELGELLPVRDCHTRVLQFDHDIAEYRSVTTLADFPASPKSRPSHMAVLGHGPQRRSMLVDRHTARILELSDGARTAREIAEQLDREFENTNPPDHLQWIEELFLSGMVGLRGKGIGV